MANCRYCKTAAPRPSGAGRPWDLCRAPHCQTQARRDRWTVRRWIKRVYENQRLIENVPPDLLQRVVDGLENPRPTSKRKPLIIYFGG